ncbi:MAG: AAA family ATPase, partial [Leptolyngbyaceae cyanobacterium]
VCVVLFGVVAFGGSVCFAGCVAFGVVFGVVGGVAVGVTFGMFIGVSGGVAAGIALGLGTLRLPLYLALAGGLWQGHHPLWWDELAVLPFLRTRKVINPIWQQGNINSLQQLAQLTSNPFQHWVLQRALYRRLHQSTTALPFLYQILTLSTLEAYAIAPVQASDWRDIPSVRQVFVSELAGLGKDASRFLESWVWQLTQPLRLRKTTPLTVFAMLLYYLTWDIEPTESLPTDFDLAEYQHIYSRLSDYPGGQEIQQSFDCMAQYLNYASLENLALAQACTADLPAVDTAIRPPVIQTLQQLGAIGKNIRVFQAATSRLNQLAALGRAIDSLEELQEYINDAIHPPEQQILLEIVRRWRKPISETSGQLGELTIAEPVTNPYVAGNPVAGELFVGREEILRELEELWLEPGQADSVVLYGHRRMGKSSILKNLPNRLDPQQNWVVEFNLQRVGKVRSTGELLYALALEIYDRAQLERLPISEPEEAAFITAERSPYRAFDRWLKTLAPHMADHRFIIAVDEFELIETAMDEGRVEVGLTEFLRGIIQTTDWFVLALAGLYTLQEKTHDYWNPLFGSIKPRKVSFLSRPSAARLITQPSADFPLDYDPGTLYDIIHLTNGQPYLIQLICQNLVAQFNHQVFEAGQDSSRPISPDDLATVINSPEFFQDGGAYFTGVWRQAEDSAPAGQTQILTALSQGSKNLEQLAAETTLSGRSLEAAVQTLQSHDVIQQDRAGGYSFTVELMRRWVQQR